MFLLRVMRWTDVSLESSEVIFFSGALPGECGCIIVVGLCNSSIAAGSSDPVEGRPEPIARPLVFIISCPLYYFPHSLVLASFPFVSLFTCASCCSHVQVLWTTPVHEFHIFYSHSVVIFCIHTFALQRYGGKLCRQWTVQLKLSADS